MFTHKILSKKDKENLLNYVKDNYGCNIDKIIDYNFYLNENNNKVYICNFKVENLNLKNIINIGLYFGKFHDNNRFRLSFEATRNLNIEKNYIMLKQSDNFLNKENLFKEEIESINSDGKCPFLVVKFENENWGCVSKKDKYFVSYLPKSRKISHKKMF